MATIADEVSIVADLLGGRTDQEANIERWIAATYRDIASTIPFETLEATENTVLVANADAPIDYPTDARAIKSIVIGIPAAAPTTQTPLYKRNVAIIDRYGTSSTGIPSIWAPFGNQIVLRAVPNDAYPLTIRYWQKVVLSEDLAETELLVPDDWLEIIEYGAQLRGYIALQDPQGAASVRLMLYGDPKLPDKPGLIKQRLTQIQAENANANYGVRPRITRYTNVP